MDRKPTTTVEDGMLTSTESAGEKPAPPPTSAIPDGGFVAWYQVAGSFCLFMNCWGIINTFGVFQTFYQTDLLAHRESGSNISYIGSVQGFLLIFVGNITGPLFDWGYFRHLLLVGSALVVFGMMMTSLCTEYWQIMLAQGITVGLGSGCLFVPSIAILPTYFSTKKAAALGIAAAGSSLGGVLYPIIFHRLQPRIGFPWATRVLAFIALATQIIPIVGMRTRTRPKQARKLLEWAAWREPPFTLFSLACFFGFMGAYIPFYYIGLYAEHVGVPAETAFYLFAILNAGSLFGRISMSVLADRTGPLNTIIFPITVCVVLAFSWLRVTSLAGLVVFCIVYGFFSGPFVSLPPAVLVTLSPTLSVVGARMGMNFSLGAVGLLIGNPIAGAILGRDVDGSMDAYNWTGLICFCGACLAASSLCMVAARVTKVGWSIKTRA